MEKCKNCARYRNKQKLSFGMCEFARLRTISMLTYELRLKLKNKIRDRFMPNIILGEEDKCFNFLSKSDKRRPVN